MEENKENVNVSKKYNGLNIASMVLGIVAIVLWCMWFLSIPCAILALIFGIIGIKKPGKGMAIAGIVTGAITLAIWALIFVFAIIGSTTYNSNSFLRDTYSYMYNY